MNALRTRLGLNDEKPASDIGLSIVEVIVAMFIFAIISTGAIYSMLKVLQVTRDSRSQQVAANLAAQDIDLARDYDDLFKLLPDTYDVPLNGDVFTVTRLTEWVSSNGNDVKCASGGGQLSYKRVNVTVTWGTMRTGAEAVHADTVIDPASRITDPTKGTLLIFVKKDSGAGSEGVTVTATPSSPAAGAVTPSPNTAVTDEAGCAYILKVTPGNYNITVSHSPATFVDDKQALTAEKTLGVQASATASVGFQYDDAGVIKPTYASNYVNVTRPKLPTNLETTFSNTYGTSVAPIVASNQYLLHPFVAGYDVVAGDKPDCRAVDPEAWAPGSFGSAPPTVTTTTTAGVTTVTPVPMGVVNVKVSALIGNNFVRAVSVDSKAGGAPGCTVETTYRFGQILPTLAGGQVQIALPFGTWKIYLDNSNTSTSNGNFIGSLSTVQLTVLTGGSATAGTVVLDPRPMS